MPQKASVKDFSFLFYDFSSLWYRHRLSVIRAKYWPNKGLNAGKPSLREKCPSTKFFQVCTFPHSDWMRRDTECLSVFSPNARKYGPEKTLYLDTFHAVLWNLKIEGCISSNATCFVLILKSLYIAGKLISLKF